MDSMEFSALSDLSNLEGLDSQNQESVLEKLHRFQSSIMSDGSSLFGDGMNSVGNTPARGLNNGTNGGGGSGSGNDEVGSGDAGKYNNGNGTKTTTEASFETLELIDEDLINRVDSQPTQW
jgi:hypothetical protein